MDAYLNSVKKQFNYYKALAEKTFAQLPDEALFWQFNAESNSIAIIVQHIAGNMLSRWTDFLTSDGEKAWRERDAEFENVITTRGQLMKVWAEGWDCFFEAIDSLLDTDLQKQVNIRNEPHTVVDAINRQLAHYPYHIGQIVFIGKMAAGENWRSLTIPKGSSRAFNAEKFAVPGQVPAK